MRREGEGKLKSDGKRNKFYRKEIHIKKYIGLCLKGILQFVTVKIRCNWWELVFYKS